MDTAAGARKFTPGSAGRGWLGGLGRGGRSGRGRGRGGQVMADLPSWRDRIRLQPSAARVRLAEILASRP